MEKVNLGVETEFVEFKESTSQTSRALESIVAMLNKHGRAHVYFGVNDKGFVVGQTIGNKTIKDLSSAITSRIVPKVIPNINLELYGELTVISVTVEGTNKPYSADGNYLIRSGSENKKIPQETLKELVYSSTPDVITEIESANQNLTFNELKTLYKLNDFKINDETFEKNIGLIKQNGKYNLLADILSDNNDVSIKVARFAGKDKSELIVRNEYGYKCLLVAMNKAMDYVLSFNETRVRLSGKLQRDEEKLFDESSFREAWINACLHNKWSTLVPPAVYIFNDRIEIISTGSLPLDFSLEDFYSGVSRPVNIQLQKIMGQLDIIEQTGFGVPEIIKHYGKEAFNIRDNFIVVTLKFPFELNRNPINQDILTPSQKNVLRAISDHPTIKTNELTEVVGLGISMVNRIIKELKELGYVERVGSNKSGYWKVK